MNANRCPHLGLKEDPHTITAFPSEANACHFVQPPQGVRPDHQLIYCLQPEHVHCPVLQSERGQPLPKDLRQDGRSWSGLWIAGLALIGLVVIAAIVGVGLEASRALDAFAGQIPTAVSTPLPKPTNTASSPGMVQPVQNSSPTASLTAETQVESTIIPTVMPSAAVCQPPEGWGVLVVPAETSLESIAENSDMSIEQLLQANCLQAEQVMPGSLLFVPPPPPTATPEPTATPVKATCEPPWGWVSYTVQEGDSLESLAEFYNIGRDKIPAANCMGDRTQIYPGQILFVPSAPRE